MPNVTLKYVLHNVPPGKCTAVFTAQGPNGDIEPISTSFTVPGDKTVTVDVYIPTS